MSRMYYGPRQASWCVTFEGRHCSSTYGVRALAMSHATDHRPDGAEPKVVRTEFCPVPGCDGYGNVKVRGVRGMYRDMPCKAHSVAIETVEES